MNFHGDMETTKVQFTIKTSCKSFREYFFLGYQSCENFLGSCVKRHPWLILNTLEWHLDQHSSTCLSILGWHTIHTQGSYSFELFKFHDFPWTFPWPFQVFQDLRFSCQFHFLTLKSSTNTNSGVHQNACHLRCLITPLYLTMSWSFHPQ